MLTKLIGTLLHGMIEAILWIILLGSMMLGWNLGDGFLGAAAGVAAGLLFNIVFFGAFLSLMDIQKSVQKIEKSVQKIEMSREGGVTIEK